MTEMTRPSPNRDNGTLAGTGLSTFDRLRQEMDKLFEDFGRGLFHLPAQWSGPEPDPLWREARRGITPVIDIVERPDRYEIAAELPGIDEKNVEVRLSNGNLIISGEKRVEKEEKEANYYMSERRYGSFQRSFRLPDGVNVEKIEATFQKGVLTIAIPKTEEAKREAKITVKAA